MGIEVGQSSPSEPPSYAVHYNYESEARLVTISNAAFTATYAYTSDGRDAGYTVSLNNGVILSRFVGRDPYRRHLVTAITNSVDGVPVSPLTFTHDLLDRVVSRNADTFGYNPRSEIISATISNTVAAYAYDPIGNRLAATNNAVATLYASSPLNQYTNILRASAPPRETFPAYDLDGNMVSNDAWSYTWDAENRLVAAYSNSLCVVSNAYDHASRRVLKVTPEATHSYLYDGWNLVRETIRNQQSSITNHFIWGKDLSGSFQGAGGIGGLLAVSVAGVVDRGLYFPFFDHNGNITAYVDESGDTVASYTFDAFGNTIAQSGPMADAFPHRFSTKYFDSETGLYYYGYRFYSPGLGRWMNRDLIEERGGLNLYGFTENNPLHRLDLLGLMARRLPPFPVMVAIHLTRVDPDAHVNTDDMMRLLRSMDSQLKWDLVSGSAPPGFHTGKQSSRLYKGACYRHVYYEDATLSSSGGGRWPLGYGNSFEATVWTDRTKTQFDATDLLGELDPAISSLGRDTAFYRIGGFMLTHEVLHSVGASHFGSTSSVMTRIPTWNWILRWPIVYQETVNRVKRKLDVRP